MPATLSLIVVGIALLVSLVTGVVSGFLPAWRAARMNPVDALRSRMKTRNATTSVLLAEAKESFFMAMNAITAHKLRSALTLLGVLVGVFSIIVDDDGHARAQEQHRTRDQPARAATRLPSASGPRSISAGRKDSRNSGGARTSRSPKADWSRNGRRWRAAWASRAVSGPARWKRSYQQTAPTVQMLRRNPGQFSRAQLDRRRRPRVDGDRRGQCARRLRAGQCAGQNRLSLRLGGGRAAQDERDQLHRHRRARAQGRLARRASRITLPSCRSPRR